MVAWRNKFANQWEKKFALFPTMLDGETVWLEWYWEKYMNRWSLYRRIHPLDLAHEPYIPPISPNSMMGILTSTLAHSVKCWEQLNGNE